MKVNLSPRNAKTFEDVCMLNTDNKDFESHRISITESHITIWDGDKSIEVPRDVFNKMLNWYNNRQPIKIQNARFTNKE